VGLGTASLLSRALHSYDTIRYDTRCYFNVRSKADIVSLIYRTETTKICKTEKNFKVKTDMLRSNSKSLGNHVVSREEDKERLQSLQREGCAEKE